MDFFTFTDLPDAEDTEAVALTGASAAYGYLDRQGHPDDALVEIHLQAAVIRKAEELLAASVTRGRQIGYSWGQLGEALGVSRQAAQQRYGARVSGPVER